MRNPEEIAILTTVSNFELYHRSLKFFPGGIPKYAVDGTKGFYGIKSLLFSIDKLKNSGINWLVMADEDVIFKQTHLLYELIEFMEEKKYLCCGMRDGGTLGWRNQNPYAINTFFSVLNLKDLALFFDKKEILKNQYILDGEYLGDLSKLKTTNYDPNSLYEGYYCFYFWLLRKGKKILYLDATALNNDETTILFDHQGREILYHTWYARFYKKDPNHTRRINQILELGKNEWNNNKYTIIENPKFKYRLLFYTYVQRLKRHWNKLMG